MVAVYSMQPCSARTAAVLARLPLTKGGLLGGVYGYLDAADRVVVADGSGAIVRVAHRGGLAAPRLVVDDRVSLAGHLPRGDAVTGLAPDYSGRLWFVTTNGVVGTVTSRPNQRPHVASMRLPRGEQMGNGLSVRPQGVSVLTNRRVRILASRSKRHGEIDPCSCSEKSGGISKSIDMAAVSLVLFLGVVLVMSLVRRPGSISQRRRIAAMSVAVASRSSIMAVAFG